MEIVRPVRLEDVDALFELTQKATHGLTSLQLNRQQLFDRVESSQFAFERQSDDRRGEPLMLVMEDLNSGRLVGTSCVFARTGGFEPFYTYRLHSQDQFSEELDVRTTTRSLHLVRIHDGPTEIGSLFLLPEYRRGGRGRLLSLCRFVLIAQRPKRFGQRVIAEMRGVCDSSGVSPFWEALGRHFFRVEFPVADALSTWSKKFIEDLMPQHPVYVDLLSPAAQATLGRVHAETEPAAAMLRNEGFVENDLIDIFDAGPVLECDTLKIGAVQRSLRGEVLDIVPRLDAAEKILASRVDGFRACFAQVAADPQNRLTIAAAEALALGVRVGSELWVMEPRNQTPCG